MTDEQASKLEATLKSPGWLEVMVPAYTQRRTAALRSLVLSPAERKAAGGEFKDLEDDALRAVVRECEWMAAIWEFELTQHRQGNSDHREPQNDGAGTAQKSPVRHRSRV